ncbi:hypothetical protein QTP88_015030 [Uroleucon formosanum]
MYSNPEKTRLLPQAMPTLFNLNCELTAIPIKPNELTIHYEQPQRTSTPTISENCHLNTYVTQEISTSMIDENSLATTADGSTCSTVSTSSQTTQKLSVNTPRKKKLKTEVSLLKAKCAKLEKEVETLSLKVVESIHCVRQKQTIAACNALKIKYNLVSLCKK